MKESKGATRAEPRSGCPLNASLEIFGDRWTLLIVRDLMFKGRRSYGELLHSDEGIATNILADRLQKLETLEIVDKAPDPSDGRKTLYRLTAKGMDLAPVLVEMIIWGARYENTEAPPETIRAMTRNRARYIARIRRRWAKGNAANA